MVIKNLYLDWLRISESGLETLLEPCHSAKNSLFVYGSGISLTQSTLHECVMRIRIRNNAAILDSELVIQNQTLMNDCEQPRLLLKMKRMTNMVQTTPKTAASSIRCCSDRWFLTEQQKRLHKKGIFLKSYVGHSVTDPDPYVLGLPDPDPLVTSADPDPDPSIITQK